VEGDPRSGSPRLLVLGAGPAQLGLLEAARARGVWTAVVDREPAAPGFRLAGRRCILSTEDEPAIERLVGALGVHGLIAPGTDWPVGIAARIAERAGLPHPLTPRSAALAVNKQRQRERLAEAGVPQPRWWIVGADDPLPDVHGPAVVKAPDRQGQKGLTLVGPGEDLAAAVETARGAARNGLALVEELVDGPEITVIGFSSGGRFTALAVTDRVVAPPPAFGVALAHVWPSHVMPLGPDVAEAAVAALGIDDGPTYTQLRVDAEGPKVIEVAARLGGGHDAELVEVATGVPLNDLAIDAALGRPVEVPAPQQLVGGAVTRFLVAPPGIFEGAEVPEGLGRVRIYREPGYVFAPLRRGADRAGAVLVTGDSREDAVERAERAAAAIRFRVASDPALAT
jgi:biotin carboxylase